MSDDKFVILCVDDEPIPLVLRKSVLERAGYSVLTASSGAEALKLLEKQRVDLVLTDMLMPGMNGTQLAREAKSRQPKVPVILYSGVNEMPEDASSADLFLSKVEGPAHMCAKISEILQRSRSAASSPSSTHVSAP